ncbi:MAG: sensor histidine kinase [Aquimonas sp.]|nr:sensor histidine kinase [Aquimonas sp.]
MRLPRAGSLHGRLLWVGLLGGLLVSLGAAWLLGEAFRSTAERAQLRILEQELAGLVGRMEVGDAAQLELRDRPGDPDYQRIFSGRYWQIGDEASGLTSRSLWDFRVQFDSPARARAQLDRVDGPAGQRLRVLRQQVTHPRLAAPVTVWVASDVTPLLDDTRAFQRFTLIAVGLLFLLLAVVLAVQVRLGLRPLRQLTAQLAEVRRGERERLGDARLPAELRPLADHLDELLAHHERSVQRARHAAADLAHALKTPLAALDAAAQRPGPELADTVLTQSARMQAVVRRQLQGGLASGFRARTELLPVARSLMELMRRIHAEHALQLDLQIPDELRVGCGEEDLQELLGNLLDNACKWARSRVCVSAGFETGRVWLQVDDDGPGMDAEGTRNARQRGIRLDERVPGSGHGLAIVEDILESLQGVLLMERSALGGLRARIEFATDAQDRPGTAEPAAAG